jgi:hypothetical protein
MKIFLEVSAAQPADCVERLKELQKCRCSKIRLKGAGLSSCEGAQILAMYSPEKEEGQVKHGCLHLPSQITKNDAEK